MPDASEFVGKGIMFPMAVDGRGSIALAGDADGVESGLRMILGTAPGERLMRPEFGCRIWDMLFDPVNAASLGRMADAVRQAVLQWEPRIELEDVVVTPDPEDASRVVINVLYRIKVTNDRRNLVYPFYVIPEEVEA